MVEDKHLTRSWRQVAASYFGPKLLRVTRHPSHFRLGPPALLLTAHSIRLHLVSWLACSSWTQSGTEGKSNLRKIAER